MLLSVTPHDPVDSSAWMWMAMDYEPTSEMVDFQDRIFAQDRPILESQRPELLPLDLQAELHLRSDRTAIAYRRWLRELGVRTGASCAQPTVRWGLSMAWPSATRSACG